MKITRLDDAKPYSAPKHSDVASLRLQGLEATPASFCSVGLSYYLPGGKAEMSAGAQEKVYVVIDGELTLQTAGGETVVLKRLDSCPIEAGESREVRNETNAVATLLVVMPAPQPN